MHARRCTEPVSALKKPRRNSPGLFFRFDSDENGSVVVAAAELFHQLVVALGHDIDVALVSRPRAAAISGLR